MRVHTVLTQLAVARILIAGGLEKHMTNKLTRVPDRHAEIGARSAVAHPPRCVVIKAVR